MNKTLQKYIAASKKYIEKEKCNKDVIGIIIAGSMQYATIDKNSDIDIHVILAPTCTYRERGNLWINGIEIEYFKNPPAQIKQYFKKEQKSPHTAHMLAFGEIAYAESAIIDELVAIAKSIIAKKPPQLKSVEIEFEKYFIDDYYKDLEDAIINKDLIGTKLIRAKIINRSVDIFFKTHQVRRGKYKRLSQQMELLDASFNRLIREALSEDWNKISAIDELRMEVEKLLGGRRMLEWTLRSPLDL